VLSSVLRNLRYSARSFIRRPGSTSALLFTIALGIASNVSVRGFVRGLTTPPSPLRSHAGLVSVFGRDAHREAGPLSRQEFLYVKSRRDIFRWFGAARVSPGIITVAGQTEFVPIAAVTPSLAGALGLSLDKGVVISQRMWQSEFGESADIRGQKIQIDGVTARISAVAPDWLEGIYRDRPVAVWMPWQEKASQRPEGDTRNFWVLAQLDRDVSVSQAQAALQRMGRAAELRVLLYTGMLPEASLGVSRVATLLEFAAGAVFFIACINVCLLLLGRSFTRFHETALRVSLGAGRRQLARELLSDSVVISVAGGASGMVLAVWTSYIVPALLYDRDAERLIFTPNLLSIIEASFVLVGIVILCGLVPVLAVPHERPIDALQRESAGASPALRRLQLGLVTAQMAGCCLLVLSAAFLRQALRAALVTSAGSQLGHTVFASVQANPGFAIEYFRRAEEAAKSVPGVSRIEWAATLPGGRPMRQSFRIVPAQLPLRNVTLDTDWITDNSLKLFKVPPEVGHMFGAAEQMCQAAIVNEEAAKKLFGEYTVGRTLRAAENSVPIEIIGVVAMRQSKPATGKNRPALYYDYTGRQKMPPRRIPDVQFRAPIVSDLAWAELETNVVSPGYFDAVGNKLVTGQGLASATKPVGCRTGIVNQEAASRYFGGKAVGAAVIDEQGRRTDIIGVAHSEPLGAFQRHVEPMLYLRMSQDVLPLMSMIIRVRQVNGLLLTRLWSSLEAVPGRGPSPVLVRTLETYLNETSLAPLHITMVLLGVSATMALLLSVLGLFGALSELARQKRRELAVRIALGAQRWRVITHVLGEGVRLTGAGALAGMLAWLPLSRWMSGTIQSSGSPALWVWVAAPLALAGVVALASVLPARRALMINPIVIMREES
jgi:hypothetical protein